jgi:hypothetical protein
LLGRRFELRGFLVLTDARFLNTRFQFDLFGKLIPFLRLGLLLFRRLQKSPELLLRLLQFLP